MSIAVAPTSGNMPAYDRDEWRHWIDEDGDCQDTRHEALVAESVSAVEYADSGQCRVASGEWVDPYTGERFADPSNLEIDHLVPLANAHASGGWAWSKSRKRAYANDLSFAGHLVAVHGPANQAKGKSGPEDWQPSNSSYWCQYAIDWITIKNSWELTATEAEVAKLAEMLDTCEPRRILESLEPVARPAATATTVAVGEGAYATCDEAEAAGEQRRRGNEGDGWGFPQSVVPSARDGDSDGVVCEKTSSSATPTSGPEPEATHTPRPAATAPLKVQPTSAPSDESDGAYASCDEAEAAGELRVKGSQGNGRGFPQALVPSARDGDRDGVVCEETVLGATPTPGPVATPTPEAPPAATATPVYETEGTYASCEEAEAAGEERVQGSNGNGRGFPQAMVPSARDGDNDGVVCEETVRGATPTPRPVATPTTEAPPAATATPVYETGGAYASCDEAEDAGEERVQGSSGSGRGFPQWMVPSARDGDDDGVVCEEVIRSATPTPDASPAATGADGVYESCDDAEAAGEERVQGSSGSGRGFPQSMVPSARDGDSDGIVCEVTVRSATPTPDASPAATGAEGVYESCEEAEDAGEERVQGSSGSGRGFPQSMVPSARDGDDDGVVCEEAVRSATPTPDAPQTDTGPDGVYASCDEAEDAGEERVQGSSGSGRGFPQSMVPSARDGDGDGVVCER